MRGKSCPNESGQSGTASPEPVLVTSPPTKMSASVMPASAIAKRCSHGRARAEVTVGMAVSSMCRLRAAGQQPILRQEILGNLGRAVLVWSAIDGRQLGAEVAVRCRCGGHPLERVGVPGILGGALPR